MRTERWIPSKGCGRTKGFPASWRRCYRRPQHFEQAAQLVTREMLGEQIPCGPAVEPHIAALQAYADAGFDELYVNQIGPEQDAFFAAYQEHILPHFR